MENRDHFISVRFLYLGLLVIILSDQITESFRHGEYLDSDSYKQLNNIGLKQCAKRCYAEAGCRSINFIKSRFSCTFSNYNSEEKPFLLDSDYSYADRNDMSKSFPGFLECPENHLFLKMHDGKGYCFKSFGNGSQLTPQECNSRLMWHNNSEVTVSVSTTHTMCSVDRASLNYGGAGVDGSAWCPSSKTSTNEFIQFEFIVTYEIQAVVTQGRADYPQWITTYSVSSSEDALTWTQVGGDYTGNSDSNTLVTNNLPSVVKSKYLRIYLISYNSFPSIRFDLIGCRV